MSIMTFKFYVIVANRAIYIVCLYKLFLLIWPLIHMDSASNMDQYWILFIANLIALMRKMIEQLRKGQCNSTTYMVLQHENIHNLEIGSIFWRKTLQVGHTQNGKNRELWCICSYILTKTSNFRLYFKKHSLTPFCKWYAIDMHDICNTWSIDNMVTIWR